MENDKIRIQLHMGGVSFPITIARSDEEIYRKAAKRVDSLIKSYSELYGGNAMSKVLIPVMAAFHVSLEKELTEQEQDMRPLMGRITELDDELRDYLKANGSSLPEENTGI